MVKHIEESLAHLRTPFHIIEDGTSQTKLTNYGRFGFHVERVFGIGPNNDRAPDLGKYELKTTQRGKKVSIGTMTNEEFHRIKYEKTHSFVSSDPYTKMKNSIIVVYSKWGSSSKPIYQMDGWGVLSIDQMPSNVVDQLQRDYDMICKEIARSCVSRDHVTSYLQDYGSISGTYLSLSYKGQGGNGYNYPAWNFQAAFMKKISHS